jgi:Helicase conserved C-terminal domain/SNF2-related domain
MPRLKSTYTAPSELVLGSQFNKHVPEADQARQRREVDEILRRLQAQPGVILADEVGMGKTFVALAIAYTVAISNPRGPVIVMVPANLIDKWEQDLKSFCELYLVNRHPVRHDEASVERRRDGSAFRYGFARHSIELMRLLDNVPRDRCHLVLLAQGAMSRNQSDKWIRLALIAEALRRHGRGGAVRLIQVKNQIHRFLAELLWAIGEEQAHDLGDELWQRLLKTDCAVWKDTYNAALSDERRRLADNPVPKFVSRALDRVDLKPLAAALERMPVRERGGAQRVTERINEARNALRLVEHGLWKTVLSEASWRSPLLVMDEAHHLKNPATALARQLQSAQELANDLRIGDGAMAHAFDRMLFLTATPFQLGHHELVRVLERFGDVRWDPTALGDRALLDQQLQELANRLNESQRTAMALQRAWGRLHVEDCAGNSNDWWDLIARTPKESLGHRVRAVVDAYAAAKHSRNGAQEALKPWIVRHNKGVLWAGSNIERRRRLDGAQINEGGVSGGLPVPPEQLLPFFLAARSAASAGQDLLSEALCSSYEAFRFTRKSRDHAKDTEEDGEAGLAPPDLSHSRWYLSEFDASLERFSGSMHPKMHATVQRVVDLWEGGEKVLVFAFYRHTCRALRIHISREIDKRIIALGQRRLRDAGVLDTDTNALDTFVERVQSRFFDDADSPGRRAVDRTLNELLDECSARLEGVAISVADREALMDVMRRFLRVPTTLVRCFPVAGLGTMKAEEAIAGTIDHVDGSGISWRRKFEGFVDFLFKRCSHDERRLFLEAAQITKTGRIRVEHDEDEESGPGSVRATLANVQSATGKTQRDTRSRLTRAFNTPFFPDILVCSQVMAEGVDLQRFCRHVVHHDLDWNPSSIEQRTGRIDRLGCKAEGRQPIVVYLPYLAGTADERQYRVMSEREQWFRVVMGQDEVARLITPDNTPAVPLANSIAQGLNFDLSLPNA